MDEKIGFSSKSNGEENSYANLGTSNLSFPKTKKNIYLRYRSVLKPFERFVIVLSLELFPSITALVTR